MERTIAAIATPAGKGGVAIVRLSGKESLKIAEKMFTPTGKTAVPDFEAYRLYPGTIDGGAFTDYGLCVYFKSPKSYTGEDVIEFQCHGGESIARGILARAFALGAKAAGKGEFTRRAFLNGKLSLASAEGVADMIGGESEAELRAGYFLYSEKLTGQVKALQNGLKEVLAGIDASVDYPEEDVEEETTEEIKQKLQTTVSEISRLLTGYSKGKKIKSGVTVAICGKPNTGKSSLLNKLLGYDKAIVSEIAGTTRDAVEGTLEIEGVKFNLYDTAGVRESGDRIESIGIDKAEAIIKGADIAVFVVDGTRKLDEEDARALELASGRPVVKVYNKIDLIDDETETDADVRTSATTGAGIHKLKALLYEKSMGERGEDMAFLVEERHYDALLRAKAFLEKAVEACGVMPLDLIGLDVTDGWSALGEITGETASEAIIEEIFSKFCVGK